MFWDLLLLAEKVQKDEIWNIAAQLSYFLLLSFFPFMIAIVSLLEYEPAAISLLMEQLEAILPKVSYQLIQENVQVFSEWNSGMFSVGFISALWVATKGSKAIYRCLNQGYESSGSRHFIAYYFISFCITVSLVLFIVLSLAVILLSNRFIVQHITNGHVTFLLSQLRIWLMFFVFVFALAVIYSRVPRIRLTFRQVLPGAVVATVLWIVCTVGFELYVTNFGNYTVVYGTLGGFVVLLLWLYLVSFSLLLGNEINAFLYQKEQRKEM